MEDYLYVVKCFWLISRFRGSGLAMGMSLL